MRRHQHRSALLCACLLLAACGGDKTATTAQQPGEESLPKPDAVSGSVTGMPNPGMPSSQPAPVAQSSGMVDDTGIDEGMAEASTAALDTPPPDGADAAVLVLRGYYAAINARDYGKAYTQWSDGGRASGQSPQQFADGFAETAGVSVAFGEPGLIEGAAGSRYIDIPATVDATQVDGSIRHYAGSFTLRMTTVDGASEAQRHWHIASADLREASR